MGIKVKTRLIDGQQRVDPDVMEMLNRYVQHRDICDECAAAWKANVLTPCKTGFLILEELGKHPDVSEYKEGEFPI